MCDALHGYRARNLKSVENAPAAIGAGVSVTTNPADAWKSEGIILRGVGAFAEGMEILAAKRDRRVLPER